MQSNVISFAASPKLGGMPGAVTVWHCVSRPATSSATSRPKPLTTEPRSPSGCIAQRRSSFDGKAKQTPQGQTDQGIGSAVGCGPGPCERRRAGAEGNAVRWPLTPETVAIDTLTADPRNARLHSEKNLDAIKASLQRFGQRKPIVLDADGVVIAGNGTMAAAVALGWKEIAVCRSELRGPEARAYALADNRSAELAEWDLDELHRTIAELEETEIPLTDVGFTDEELDALDDEDFEEAHGFAPKREKEEKPQKTYEAVYKVIIHCKDEAEQAEIIRWCEKKKLEYKAPSV
jgi:ParB-like chromosome segregation protein Spo0J